ncbi:hypothetical protein [Streptomyces sp. NPDC015131]|uniref:hypothetical protein n=1 Tax=Streptomyces sp. NPDC015131 TaxID=3364941 RepID=UPI0036FB6D4F
MTAPGEDRERGAGPARAGRRLLARLRVRKRAAPPPAPDRAPDPPPSPTSPSRTLRPQPGDDASVYPLF